MNVTRRSSLVTRCWSLVARRSSNDEKRETRNVFALLAMVALAFIAGYAIADTVLLPQNATFTHIRDEATANGNEVTYWRGDTLLFTNCVCYSGATTNTAVQMLSNVVVTVRMGTLAVVATYTGVVQSAAAGTYACSVTVPTNTDSSVYMQTKLTDSLGNSYSYPWKIVNTKAKL